MLLLVHRNTVHFCILHLILHLILAKRLRSDRRLLQTTWQKHAHCHGPCRSMATRSYPTPEVRVAAERSNPTPEVRAVVERSNPTPDVRRVAKRSNPTSKRRWLRWRWRRRVERSYSTFKVRRGGHEEIPLVQGKELWPHFAEAAMKR